MMVDCLQVGWILVRSISDVRNYYPPFITSSLSFKFFPAIRYIVPIVSTCFNSSIPFVTSTSFLSFQRFHLGHLPFPFVSQGVHLVTSFHSFQLVHPVRLPIRFVATRPFHLLLLSFGFHSCISFVASSLSFQLFPSVRYVIPFVSTLPFHSLFPLFVSALPSRSFTSSFVSSH